MKACRVQARIDGTALPAAAIEAGVRAVVPMSATTAATLLHKMRLASVESAADLPSTDTLRAVLLGLAKSQDSQAYAALVASVEPPLLAACAAGEMDAGRTLNVMLRSLARLDVEAAVRRAEDLAQGGVEIEPATYGQFATSSVAAGKQALASEMLELRDYL